jgi:hypothetical protein
MNFFSKWKDELPKVAASLTTALLIFAASTVAYRFRAFFYPPFEGFDYPLVCRAEAVSDPKAGTLTVEFYVINKTGDDYDELVLNRMLREQSQGTNAVISPVIQLVADRQFTAVDLAAEDKAFNNSKGELTVRIIPDNVVEIGVPTIKSRAILRALIVVSGLPDLEDVRRDRKADIPFAISPYERACYSRS